MTKSTGKFSLQGVNDGIKRWFREMRSELKKVVWPTRKKLINNTIVAIVMMVVCGIVIGAFDQIALFIVRRLISLGSLIGA